MLQGKLRNGKVFYIGKKQDIEKKDRFNYMLLGRLISDLEYFLEDGCGNMIEKHLFSGNIEDQFKDIYELFSKIKIKPKFLSIREIEKYKKEYLKLSKIERVA